MPSITVAAGFRFGLTLTAVATFFGVAAGFALAACCFFTGCSGLIVLTAALEGPALPPSSV
jgi:hypothetical protein